MSDQAIYQYDLHISYAEANNAWVQGYLIPALGLPEQRVITRQAFRPGAPLVTEFERAVTSSRYTILILSPAYLADEWSSLGEQLASYLTIDQQQERLIPLRLEPCAVPLRINFRVGLDCINQANWESEISRMRALLNQPEPLLGRINCPYRGMVPFRADDARFFFGRESEIDDMLQRLRHQGFLMVVGDSGSGKSSLINAGLLPKLNESTYFPPGYWLVRTMRPGNQPLQVLSQIVGVDLSQPAESITTLLADHPPAQRLLLVIDQFEELFTQARREDQSQFITTLRALRAIGSCALLIALRGDFFYTDLTDSALWPVPISERLEIAPLRGEALRAAIEKPAARKGVYLEAGLVQRLLDDAVDQPGVLPLVQETMVQLWDKMERCFISLDAYGQLGAGERSALAGALVTKANATLMTLAQRSPHHETIARRIFMRLVQFGEGRPDTRRQQSESALRSKDDDLLVFDETLQHLAQNRLLTLSGEEGDKDRKVDIAHEALFTEWPALKERVREWRTAEQTRRRLEDWATNWVERGRDSKALLNPVELDQVDQWLNSPAAGELGYSADLVALAGASRKALRIQRLRQWSTAASVSIVVLALLAVLTIVGQREWLRRNIGTELVPIEGGSAIIGTDNPAAEPNVTLLPFQIEKYEVSNAQYRACVGYFGPWRLGPCDPPENTESIDDEDRDDYPVTYVSAKDAHAYCIWLGRRLPTTVEWERAARGIAGRLWPWGNNSEDYEFPPDLVPVDWDDKDQTPEKIFHLAYNVSEWVVQVTVRCEGVSCQQAWDENTITIARMGRAPTQPNDYVAHVAALRLESPGAWAPQTGFRCAADSAP